MSCKHVNTRSSYCVSVVGVYKIWWAWVGTVSDFVKLLGYSTAERLPTAGRVNETIVYRVYTQLVMVTL
jgi:hypothetical protein